ncbi:putative O-methyltransferase, family 3 [Mycolicibacterium insubricum]|uniref:O-methyltransferase n=1 Tax=Mycolicibacterium insubricum TaxID=444597 RepID=UPI00138C1470|nr:class I SAM-dependent methyltransferase [Mycolicibacterium insubricum]BBZ67065.1 putative O-methyltransferase, family 3 [Mycolicibacterium insubricum]
MTTLQSPAVATVLDRMYAESGAQFEQLRSPDSPLRAGMKRLAGASAQERADALAEVYMPVSPEAGRLLYSLVRATRPAVVVEFGMSLGISAIHLAAGVRDNGTGRVITTELSAVKIAAARATFDEVGLAEEITILDGDATQTLADVDGPVGLVLLDGWKELYLPVIKLLEPKLAPGALILADNTSHAETQPYLDYVREPGSGYVSVNITENKGGDDPDGMEITCWTARG